MSSAADLPTPPDGFDVEAAIERAVEEIVNTAQPETCRALLDDLQARDALWDGMLQLLGPTAGRPLFGLGEERAAKRLAVLADTPDRITALSYRLWAAHRAQGGDAAHEVWAGADPQTRYGAALQLLVAYCRTVGGESGRLDARATVRLTRTLVPITW
ncbi:hypothetical protein ACIQF6_28130 [Kitasatospora sp. NPDC092948]|uniref:hypothetical protein n=1 Tax=Kitasatospora sp. NPDC092948 TaxID=3364088 RepID=UPI0038019E33